MTRVGLSYSLSQASVTTFNDNTRNVFQSLAFRSGVEGQNQLTGIITSVVTPSFTFSSLDRAVGPHSGNDFNVDVQVAGVGGNVKYISPVASYRQFFPMKGLRVNREGHNVLGYRLQFAHVEGFGGEVAPPTQPHLQRRRIGRARIRCPFGLSLHLHSEQGEFNLTNPDGTTVPRDPTNPALGNIQIPLPIYRMVQIGGDTQLTANLEYRIPIVNQVTSRSSRLWPDVRCAARPVAAERRGAVAYQRRVIWLPDVSSMAHAMAVSRSSSPIQLNDRAGYQLRAAHVERRRTSGDSADRQCSVPHLTTRITRCGYTRTFRSNWRCRTRDRMTEYLQELLPEQRSRPVQLPAGAAVLRRRLHSARAAVRRSA